MNAPSRWVVERSFGWLNRFPRLARDYERLPETSAFCRLRHAYACPCNPSTSKFLTPSKNRRQPLMSVCVSQCHGWRNSPSLSRFPVEARRHGRFLGNLSRGPWLQS